jgi:hypothetical protein
MPNKIVVFLSHHVVSELPACKWCLQMAGVATVLNHLALWFS